MSNPQQPELARSRKTPSQDQDAVAGVVEGQRDLSTDAPRGPVPAENEPGHHPPEEQDKPDLDAFAERLGTREPDQRESADDESRPAPVAAAKQAVSVAAETAHSAGRGGAMRAVLGAAAVALLAVLLIGQKRRRKHRH